MDNDVALDFGEEHNTKKKKAVVHPAACFFHIIFRLASIIVYLFCGYTTAGFVGSFICILLLLSADFWTVKNISGRLLVGLRWWNQIDEGGKSHWVYESRKPSALKRHPLYAAESRIFWLGLIISPVIWVFLLFGTIISLKMQWLAVVLVALGLNGANLFGYIRCKVSNRTELRKLATGYIGSQIFKQATQSDESTQP